MFDIWLVPIAIVIAVILLIGILSVIRKPAYNPERALNSQDRSIAEPIEDHPVTFNPIFWVIAIAALFMGIIIMYYWASF